MARDCAEQALAISVRVSDRHGEALSSIKIGQLRALQGAWPAAFAAIEQGLAQLEAVGDERGVRNALSRLAAARLQSGDVEQALALVDRSLSGSPDGAGHAGELDVAQVCNEVLAAAGDPRADRVLVRAYTELQAAAARIGDTAVRARMLREVSHHRALVRAWSRRTPIDPPAAQDLSAP